MAESKRKQRARHAGLKTVTVIFVCAGIAFLGLLGGGEQRLATARQDQMRGYFPAGMPIYPSGSMLPAGVADVNGRSSRMAYLFSEDDADRIGHFYAERWKGQGLWVRSDITHQGGVVSAVDDANQRVFQVLILRRDKRSLIIPSVTKLASAESAADRAKRAPPLPLFPKSRQLYNVDTANRMAGAKVSLSVAPTGFAEALDHYRRVLTGNGYRIESDSAPPKPMSQELSRRQLIGRRHDGSEATIEVAQLSKTRTRVHIVVVEAK
ncbi:MAG: hypothetical protein H6707_03505 [Deltaproteobacteria bacterium]|nr:hypothetical protein [Deltaproteobacteria bacterium]